MPFVRAIFSIIVALSVALLPAPVAFAHVHAATGVSVHALDCCDSSKQCEKQTRECGSPAGCALKCFTLHGAVPGAIAVAQWPVADKAQVAADQDFAAPTNSPPLPPPRS
jgi:hypothetical protein